MSSAEDMWAEIRRIIPATVSASMAEFIEGVKSATIHEDDDEQKPETD